MYYLPGMKFGDRVPGYFCAKLFLFRLITNNDGLFGIVNVSRLIFYVH